jgi:DNA-binding NtrC family response regulator
MPQQGLTARFCDVAHFGRLRRHDTKEEQIMKPLKVLVVEDAAFLLDHYVKRLGTLDNIKLIKVPTMESIDQALEVFKREAPDVVITDLSLTSSHTEGFGILRTLKRACPGICVVLTTSVYSPDNHDKLNEHIRHSKFDAVFHKLDLDNLVVFLRKRSLELALDYH